jgi:tape measure domain-containing protein
MASQYGVAVEFSAKTRELDAAVSKLKGVDAVASKLQGKLGSTGREFQTAANGMRYYIDAIGKARKENGQFVSTAEAAAAGIKRQGAAAQGAAGAIRGLASAFAGLSIGNKLRGAFMDAANLDATNARAKNLTQTYGQLAGIQAVATKSAAKFQISNEQSLSDLVDLGNRLGAQGTSLKDIQNIYEGFNTLLIKNKVGAQQASAAQLQLNQALGSGRLAGEEFNAISESAPQLLDEVARILKKSRGELKQLASDGEISSQVLIQALTNIRTQGAGDLESALSGPAGEMRRFNKALSDFSVTVGQELLPAVTPLLKAGTELLKLFGTLPGPVKTAAVGMTALGAAALVAAPAIGTVVSALAALNGAAIGGALLAAGPWLAAAAGIAALGKALYDTNDDFRNFTNNIGGVVASDFNSAVDRMAADADDSANAIAIAYQDLQRKLAPIGSNIQKMFTAAFGNTSKAADVSAKQSTNAFSNFFSSIVSQGAAAFGQLSSLVSSWWSNLPAPIRNHFSGGAIGDLVGGLNYAGGATRRATQGPGYGQTSRFAGARDAAHARAQTITGATQPPAALTASAGGGGAGAKPSKTEQKLMTLTGLALNAGFSPANARIMAAIALAESGGNTMAHNTNRATGDNSYGLWQINMIDRLGPERRRQFGLQSNEQLFNPQINAQAAKGVFDSQGFGAWSVFKSGAYKQFLGQDATVNGGDASDVAQAYLEQQQALEQSLQAGRELAQQFERELAIRNAITPLEREILQIKHDTADRQVQIDALLDKEQQTMLTLLNTDLERLRVLEAQVKAFYDQADAAGVLAEKMQGIGGKAFGGSTGGASGFAPGMPNLSPGSGSGDKLGEQFSKVKQELADLQNPVNQITAGAQAIGSAFGTAFKDVASGAKTAEQALADAFQSIGNHFLDMASQMIAKWIEMQIIGLATSLLGGLGSPTGAAASGGYKLPSGGGFAQGFSMPPMFEGGGYTGDGARAGGLDGKGGFPAILHPGETVKDHRASSARAALKGGEGGAAPTINIQTGNVVQFEGANYVSMADFEMGLAKAANQGAERGHRKTLDKLRQSPQTRRSLGM